MQLAVQKPAVAVGALYAFLSPQRLFGRPRQVLARLPKHLLEQSLKATWHIMSSSTPTFTVLRLALGLTDADVNTINGGNFTLLADRVSTTILAVRDVRITSFLENIRSARVDRQTVVRGLITAFAIWCSVSGYAALGLSVVQIGSKLFGSSSAVQPGARTSRFAKVKNSMRFLWASKQGLKARKV